MKMRINTFGLVAALSLLGVSGNSLLPSSISAKPPSQFPNAGLPGEVCTPRLTTPPPSGYNCGTQGKLTAEKLLSNAPAATRDRCVTRCKVDNENKCISFGYNAKTKDCRLYRLTLDKQGYKDKTSQQGYVYWNRRCWTVSCTGPCEHPVPPPGDFVTNGGFECGINPWVPESLSDSGSTQTTVGKPGYDSPDQLSFQAFHDQTQNGPVSPLAGVRQNFTLPSGGQYNLSFALKFSGVDNRITYGTKGTLLGVDRANNYDFTSVDQWHTITTPFQGQPGEQTLEFLFYGIGPDQNYTYLDDVSVVEVMGYCSDLNPPNGDFVANGGFECGLIGWDVVTFYGNNSQSSATASPPGYGGVNEKSFQASNYGNNLDARIQLLQSISGLETGSYSLSFRVKFSGNHEQLLISFGRPVYFAQGSTIGSVQWHTIEGVIVLPPDRPSPLIFEFTGLDGDILPTIYLDDVSVIEKPVTCPSPASGELITNGGFECGLSSWNTVTHADPPLFPTFFALAGPPSDGDDPNGQSFQASNRGAVLPPSDTTPPAVLSQMVQIPDTAAYQFKLRVRFTGVSQSIRVDVDNQIGQSQPAGLIGQWEDVVLPFVLGSGSHTFAISFFGVGGAAPTIFVDNVSVTRLGPIP